MFYEILSGFSKSPAFCTNSKLNSIDLVVSFFVQGTTVEQTRLIGCGKLIVKFGGVRRLTLYVSLDLSTKERRLDNKVRQFSDYLLKRLI